MDYVMLVFFFSVIAGPHIDAVPFSSLEACEAERARVVAFVKEHNASGENQIKIDKMAVACAPVRLAPRGKDV